MSLKSLEYLSLTELLSHIPQNTETQKALDEYVLTYLQNRPSVLDTYFETHYMYHVFFREEDPYGRARREHGEDDRADIHLLKSFATFDFAQKWIITNGKAIVDEKEDDYLSPIVLTIIKYDNAGNDNMHTEMTMISNNRYPTYAFSVASFDMLLREHTKQVKSNWQDTLIPYWLNYCESADVPIRKLSMSDFKNIINSFTYSKDDERRKRQHVDDMVYFLKNPDKYILKI